VLDFSWRITPTVHPGIPLQFFERVPSCGPDDRNHPGHSFHHQWLRVFSNGGGWAAQSEPFGETGPVVALREWLLPDQDGYE
jgi:hypothetical protein